ncbi:hypothetical protein DFJ73DRAFT_839708 [Zopfochytrium polystomum]|nr:hypothetical protein DFJ73DRAFT_839708 [Zopfochytrium polystomum]
MPALPSGQTQPQQHTVAIAEPTVQSPTKPNDYDKDFIPRAIYVDPIEELANRPEGPNGRRAYASESRFNSFLLEPKSAPKFRSRSLSPYHMHQADIVDNQIKRDHDKKPKEPQKDEISSVNRGDERVVILTEDGMEIIAPAVLEQLKPLPKAWLQSPSDEPVYHMSRHKALPPTFSRTIRASTWKNTVASATEAQIERARENCGEMIRANEEYGRSLTLRYSRSVDWSTRPKIRRSGLSFRGRGVLEDKVASGEIPSWTKATAQLSMDGARERERTIEHFPREVNIGNVVMIGGRADGQAGSPAGLIRARIALTSMAPVEYRSPLLSELPAVVDQDDTVEFGVDLPSRGKLQSESVFSRQTDLPTPSGALGSRGSVGPKSPHTETLSSNCPSDENASKAEDDTEDDGWLEKERRALYSAWGRDDDVPSAVTETEKQAPSCSESSEQLNCGTPSDLVPMTPAKVEVSSTFANPWDEPAPLELSHTESETSEPKSQAVDDYSLPACVSDSLSSQLNTAPVSDACQASHCVEQVVPDVVRLSETVQSQVLESFHSKFVDSAHSLPLSLQDQSQSNSIEHPAVECPKETDVVTSCKDVKELGKPLPCEAELSCSIPSVLSVSSLIIERVEQTENALSSSKSNTSLRPVSLQSVEGAKGSSSSVRSASSSSTRKSAKGWTSAFKSSLASLHMTGKAHAVSEDNETSHPTKQNEGSPSSQKSLRIGAKSDLNSTKKHPAALDRGRTSANRSEVAPIKTSWAAGIDERTKGPSQQSLLNQTSVHDLSSEKLPPVEVPENSKRKKEVESEPADETVRHRAPSILADTLLEDSDGKDSVIGEKQDVAEDPPKEQLEIAKDDPPSEGSESSLAHTNDGDDGKHIQKQQDGSFRTQEAELTEQLTQPRDVQRNQDEAVTALTPPNMAGAEENLPFSGPLTERTTANSEATASNGQTTTKVENSNVNGGAEVAAVQSRNCEDTESREKSWTIIDSHTLELKQEVQAHTTGTVDKTDDIKMAGPAETTASVGEDASCGAGDQKQTDHEHNHQRERSFHQLNETEPKKSTESLFTNAKRGKAHFLNAMDMAKMEQKEGNDIIKSTSSIPKTRTEPETPPKAVDGSELPLNVLVHVQAEARPVAHSAAADPPTEKPEGSTPAKAPPPAILLSPAEKERARLAAKAAQEPEGSSAHERASSAERPSAAKGPSVAGMVSLFKKKGAVSTISKTSSAASMESTTMASPVQVAAKTLPADNAVSTVTAEMMSGKVLLKGTKCEIRVEHFELHCTEKGKPAKHFFPIELRRVLRCEQDGDEAIVHACVTRKKGMEGSKLKKLKFQFEEGGPSKATLFCDALMRTVYGGASSELHPNLRRGVLVLVDKFDSKEPSKIVEKHMKPVWDVLERHTEVKAVQFNEFSVANALQSQDFSKIGNVVVLNNDFAPRLCQVLVRNQHCSNPVNLPVESDPVDAALAVVKSCAGKTKEGLLHVTGFVPKRVEGKLVGLLKAFKG